jgi:flagellar motor protein MotB
MGLFGAARKPRDRGESWQIIYMDLMTIIMVFFVILWSINQGKDTGISEAIGDMSTRMINLPGDVLFTSGQTTLSQKGREVFKTLFDDPSGEVLNFDAGGLVRRVLIIHGHTDGDGDKDDNFELAYRRARTAYRELKLYSESIPDHVIICSHADNTPEQEVPRFEGTTSKVQRSALRTAKSKNRRIGIEDKLVHVFGEK